LLARCFPPKRADYNDYASLEIPWKAVQKDGLEIAINIKEGSSMTLAWAA
jgi:hypothetical protein